MISNYEKEFLLKWVENYHKVELPSSRIQAKILHDTELMPLGILLSFKPKNESKLGTQGFVLDFSQKSPEYSHLDYIKIFKMVFSHYFKLWKMESESETTQEWP